MKKYVLLFVSALIAVGASSQEWKLSTVWSDAIGSTYLYFASPAGEGPEEAFFTLLSCRTYDEASSTYFEVEYFRFPAKETYGFLTEVRDFAERNRSGKAVANIRGIKVKTLQHPVTGNYTCVYNGRDFCMYKAKKWSQICDDFVEFCRKNWIRLE